ncbi:MAG: hypothetical protein QM622_07445 [Microbacterium sp.]
MMARPKSHARLAGVVLATALLVTPLTGCSLLGSVVPGQNSTEQGDDIDMQTLYDAVAAADPRVKDPVGQVYYSGFSQTLDLVVMISGDEPVSTETLTAIFIAARDNTTNDIETITVLAWDAEDEEVRVDLSPAIDGLPDDVTVLWDGGATIARTDLDKLTLSTSTPEG